MKHDPIPPTAAPATLQDVIDRLAGGSLPDTRKRDLRSAVVTYAKLTDRPPAAIPLDLADIRRTLDGMVPVQAKVSRKRWANLRSDLAAAFDASGLRPMLKTAGVELDDDWTRLFQPVTDLRVRNGLSRFARWASLRRITAGGRRRRRHRALHCGTGGVKPDPQRWCPAPQRGTHLEYPVCSATRPQPARRRGAGEQAGADSRAVGAASSLLPSGCRSVPRLVCNARPARRAGAGKSACAADACDCGATRSIRP